MIVAVFIFIFSKALIPYVGFLVGAVVCMYALEELIVYAAKKILFSDPYHLFDSITQLIIGVILFIVSYDIIKVCLVWGVWSILRESKEMAEAITKLSARKTEIINVVESVIIIALSFTMILEPNESHAYLHIILLGIELVIVVLFYFAEIGGKIIMERKSQTTENNDKDTNISI